MTREEAIERIKEIKDRAWGYHIDKEVIGIPYSEFLEIMDSALSALRPVSREQVEKVWRGEWIEDKYSFSHCPLCGYEQEEPELITPFCPNCGAPMTDKAVDIVMEKIKEVQEGK